MRCWQSDRSQETPEKQASHSQRPSRNLPKQQIDEKSDQIAVAGQVLSHETFVYYVLNKPKGVISATEDDRHRTVLDLLDNTARQKEVFPVGRLDIDTHGLLLLTNNGQLAHVMLSPKNMLINSTVHRWTGS